MDALFCLIMNGRHVVWSMIVHIGWEGMPTIDLMQIQGLSNVFLTKRVMIFFLRWHMVLFVLGVYHILRCHGDGAMAGHLEGGTGATSDLFSQELCVSQIHRAVQVFSFGHFQFLIC